MFAVPPNTLVQDAQRAAAHPARIAIEVAADRSRWAHLLRYDPTERYTALLEKHGDQEIWIMSWLPGQRTELHDHGGATGAYTIVTGTLVERVARVADNGRPVELVHALKEGQTRVFGPNYVHEVVNEGPDPAVSIHVFEQGRRPMPRYRMDYATGPVRD
ncbi:putative metal-dependent enzyme (double-stranded beta helix superfamily) [Crossiella equi]|uniref:Metal-dependent enzyme (Double-stranded beta helix superfamily) n=1 Tax=Crossiella equi TaxID=130796 RepID=A0ABS5AK71_9PSEU|nr:cysteine dioxygenase family protein [Crossiella equi]MBP2476973.1 putative metal-dependent enzyme (double-stranded beta helix superfamily) [Crossiella equi]